MGIEHMRMVVPCRLTRLKGPGATLECNASQDRDKDVYQMQQPSAAEADDTLPASAAELVALRLRCFVLLRRLSSSGDI